MAQNPRKAAVKADVEPRGREPVDRERSRRRAAAAKISTAMPAAGAAILADTDPALDTESETKANLERDTGRDRMTGES